MACLGNGLPFPPKLLKLRMMSYQCSFGIAGICCSLLLSPVLIWISLPRKRWRAVRGELRPGQLLGPALLGGISFGAANVCLTAAIGLGVAPAVAVSIWQCGAIVMSGSLGVIVFKDFRGARPISGYALSAAILAAGIVVLQMAIS